jgi:alpha-D-xyloside xylohydrolase
MKSFVSALLFCFGLSAYGLGGLQPLENWEAVASGVWKAQIGQADKELAYTSLAARAPRIETLNSLPKVPFPFKDTPIEFHRSDDQLIQVRIPTDPDESIYGFGLQLDGIKKSGKVLNLNVDHWAKGGGHTHAPVPFYISSKGYGVLFNTARFLKVHVLVGNRKDSPNLPAPVDRNPPPEEPPPGPWMPQPTSDSVEAHVSANGLEMMVFSGQSLLDIVARYNLYCGGGAMPPLWGLGFWHRVPAKYNAEECEAEVQAFSDHQMPLDVLGLEPGWMTRSYPCTFEWQKHRFPDPAAFTKRMLDQGVRLNLWENPYISPEAKLYEKLYPLAGSHTVWLGIVPDYTLPEAQDILCKQHTEDHLSIGISGYKIDEVDGYDRWLWPEHALFPSGTPGESMRQAYGLIMQNMLYKNLFHKNNTRTWSLVRSSNAGASAMPFVLYSDSYNHAQYITGLSAASLGGILWTPEVQHAASAEEWRARIQTVCFSPLVQLNAWASATKPWQFEKVTGDVRDVIRLRMRLLPYLYTAFANYNRHGIPPMRAMVLEQGASEAAAQVISGKLDGVKNPYAESATLEQNDQFMFGPSILVAPYYEKQLNKRSVKLPKGNWYDFYTGELAGNGNTITVSTPERTPLFVKEGAVIPMLTTHVDRSRDAAGHPLEVRHYGQQPGSYELYEDDGKTFDFEKDAFSLRTFRFADGQGAETVTKAGEPLFGKVERWVEMTK